MSLIPEIERELLDAAQRSSQAPVDDDLVERKRPGRAIQRAARGKMLRALAATTAVMVGALLAVEVTRGPGERGVDVAAAAYRAADPAAGILHVISETKMTTPAGHATSRPVRVESWSTANPHRSHTIQTTGSHVLEQAIDENGLVSTWTSGQPDVIRRTRLRRVIGSPEDPATALRAAYRSGRVHVVGRGQLNGRPVWRLKLDAPPTRGRKAPADRIVINAKTFTPIEWTGYTAQATTPTGPLKVISRSVTRYLVFEHLPLTIANRALLRLTDRPAKIIQKRS